MPGRRDYSTGWLAAADNRLYRDGSEIVDDPDCPPAARLHIVEVLDRLNLHLGNYDRWTELVCRLAGDAGRLQVHDLAAGHGGFAIAMQQRLGLRASVTASDVDPAYLEIGRERAGLLGIPVRFVRQDACDLTNLADEPVDVFTCTQSLHHFTPGQIAPPRYSPLAVTASSVVAVPKSQTTIGRPALRPNISYAAIAFRMRSAPTSSGFS